ncbi:hypothetical protein JW766_04585 [Candidatus Dojkabacteria bacterium]|nr:hypothetical protein [Candidatus Dojkabacteria bacterium]
MSGVLQTFNNISYSREKLPDGRLKLNVEIANERFEDAKQKVYERLAPTVDVSGFRPGKAPKNVIIAKLGPTLFEQTLNQLIPECTVEVLKREKLMPLDQIAYQLEKVADGSGVKYAAVFNIFPEFELPDLTKIKATKEKAEVADSEVDSVLKQMYEGGKDVEKEDKKKEKQMNDKWASSLNLDVKNLSELKAKVKEELKRQKEVMEENKYISNILKQIVDQSKIEIPEMLTDQEVTRQETAYRKRIENLGMKVEDFLRNQKTSLEELKKGWKKEAEERLKTEMIFIKISEKYDVKVDEKEVEKHISSIKDEKMRAQYQNPEAKRYIRSVLVRQKVVDKLLGIVEGK